MSILYRDWPWKMRWVRESLKGSEESRTNSGKISTMADFAFIYMHRNDFIFVIRLASIGQSETKHFVEWQFRVPSLKLQ